MTLIITGLLSRRDIMASNMIRKSKNDKKTAISLIFRRLEGNVVPEDASRHHLRMPLDGPHHHRLSVKRHYYYAA